MSDDDKPRTLGERRDRSGDQRRRTRNWLHAIGRPPEDGSLMQLAWDTLMNWDECVGLEILPEDLEGIAEQLDELLSRGWSERAARATVKALAGLRAKSRVRRERTDPRASSALPLRSLRVHRRVGRRGTESTTIAIVPLGPPTEVDLDGLAPWVRELCRWLGPGEWLPTLAGLICWAPAGLLDDVRRELVPAPVTLVPWTLDAIVRHALLPLAELSLMDGQPVIPELGATLVAVLADPRLGPIRRGEVEMALFDSEELEGELEALAQGCDPSSPRPRFLAGGS